MGEGEEDIGFEAGGWERWDLGRGLRRCRCGEFKYWDDVGREARHTRSLKIS